MSVKWPPPKNRRPKGFSPTRDGWVKWYDGKTRFVCGKATPLGEVEDRWAEVKKSIKENRPAVVAVGELTYREVLSRFLAAMEIRVQTGKPKKLARRTLHNYATAMNAFGNFVKASTPISQIGPEEFSAYAKTISHLAPSVYDAEVARVGTLFKWAVGMEYIDKYRPGSNFVRPGKAEIRDERITRGRSFTPDEIAKLWVVARPVIRCWIALGVCCAFNNSDIGNLPIQCVDLNAGIIDFRRRKVGKVRRICPLPDDVVRLLRSYNRPAAKSEEFADLFFLTRNGTPFVSSTGKHPIDMVSNLFWKLIRAAGVTAKGKGKADGRNFAGLRTTFRNLALTGREWAEERDIIMGHFDGTIDADHYVESFGIVKLRQLVNHVWSQVSSKLPKDEVALPGDGDDGEPAVSSALPPAAQPEIAHTTA